MMKTNKKLPILILIFTLSGIFTAWTLIAQAQPSMTTSDKAPDQPKKTVKKSDAEWKKTLTPEQYRIARQSGTESPNGKIYQQFKEQGSGSYYCVGCNAKLFSSKEKFDSHCGWPSFYDPANAKNVKLIPDPDGRRIEVRCAICDAHLGHVFKGEGFNTPTDKRYCINGTILKFVPDKKTSRPDSKKREQQ